MPSAPAPVMVSTLDVAARPFRDDRRSHRRTRDRAVRMVYWSTLIGEARRQHVAVMTRWRQGRRDRQGVDRRVGPVLAANRRMSPVCREACVCRPRCDAATSRRWRTATRHRCLADHAREPPARPAFERGRLFGKRWMIRALTSCAHCAGDLHDPQRGNVGELTDRDRRHHRERRTVTESGSRASSRCEAVPRSTVPSRPGKTGRSLMRTPRLRRACPTHTGRRRDSRRAAGWCRPPSSRWRPTSPQLSSRNDRDPRGLVMIVFMSRRAP